MKKPWEAAARWGARWGGVSQQTCLLPVRRDPAQLCQVGEILQTNPEDHPQTWTRFRMCSLSPRCASQVNCGQRVRASAGEDQTRERRCAEAGGGSAPHAARGPCRFSVETKTRAQACPEQSPGSLRQPTESLAKLHLLPFVSLLQLLWRVQIIPPPEISLKTEQAHF